MSYPHQLLAAALLWRDVSLRARDPSFRKLWRRNMRDCALAWREALRDEGGEP